MPGLAHLLARFPDQELAIHRLRAREPEFQALCEDYEEAVTALRYWRERGKAGDAKTVEFSELATEIEAEILAHLDGARHGPLSRR